MVDLLLSVFSYLLWLASGALNLAICVVCLGAGTYYLISFIYVDAGLEGDELENYKLKAFFNFCLIAIVNGCVIQKIMGVELMLALLLSGALTAIPIHTIGWGRNPVFIGGLTCLAVVDAVLINWLFGLPGFVSLAIGLGCAWLLHNYCYELFYNALDREYEESQNNGTQTRVVWT
jgi:hypothetical protein